MGNSWEWDYTGDGRLKYSYRKSCPNCGGTGDDPEDDLMECDLCQGDGYAYIGQVRKYYDDPLLGEDDEAQCPKCEGEGFIPPDSDNECSLCNAYGSTTLFEGICWLEDGDG